VGARRESSLPEIDPYCGTTITEGALLASFDKIDNLNRGKERCEGFELFSKNRQQRVLSRKLYFSEKGRKSESKLKESYWAGYSFAYHDQERPFHKRLATDV